MYFKNLNICGAVLALAIVPSFAHAFQQGDPPNGSRLHGPPTAAQKQQWEEEKEKNRIRVGLTKEQQARLEDMFKASKDQLDELYKKQREKREELSTVFKEYKYDRSKANSIRRDLQDIRNQISDVLDKSEDNIRRIMNKTQFDRFQQMLQEQRDLRRKSRGDRSGGPGAPGGPPPGGPPAI